MNNVDSYKIVTITEDVDAFLLELGLGTVDRHPQSWFREQAGNDAAPPLGRHVAGLLQTLCKVPQPCHLELFTPVGRILKSLPLDSGHQLSHQLMLPYLRSHTFLSSTLVQCPFGFDVFLVSYLLSSKTDVLARSGNVKIPLVIFHTQLLCCYAAACGCVVLPPPFFMSQMQQVIRYHGLPEFGN
ncbi:hypothetical protein VNO77_25168 [Canavalia gladiata]|uniref:Uncharacterized protein n=1 Tax=Canavalia gladiata TaxID=3824 RepID=A0AAN9L888_CANGL